MVRVFLRDPPRVRWEVIFRVSATEGDVEVEAFVCRILKLRFYGLERSFLLAQQTGLSATACIVSKEKHRNTGPTTRKQYNYQSWITFTTRRYIDSGEKEKATHPYNRAVYA